jgi:hypothetical protein
VVALSHIPARAPLLVVRVTEQDPADPRLPSGPFRRATDELRAWGYHRSRRLRCTSLRHGAELRGVPWPASLFAPARLPAGGAPAASRLAGALVHATARLERGDAPPSDPPRGPRRAE